MARVLVTAPTVEPLTLTEVRTHLRIDENNTEPAPGPPTVALAGAGAGNLSDGVYRYLVTFLTGSGASEKHTEGGVISDAVTIADHTANGQVALTNIPLGGSAITGRAIYRTKVGGSTYYYLYKISNNTGTTYTDNNADATLAVALTDTNTTDDPYLTSILEAARQTIEQKTKLQLCSATWQVDLSEWASPIYLPYPPLDSVTSIKYYDESNVQQTLDTAYYDVITTSFPGAIVLNNGYTWPNVYDRSLPISITYVAGYGVAADVPAPLRHAILLLLGQFYDRREEYVVGASVASLPSTVNALISPYKIVESF